jgi:hypothetical protein
MNGAESLIGFSLAESGGRAESPTPSIVTMADDFFMLFLSVSECLAREILLEKEDAASRKELES